MSRESKNKEELKSRKKPRDKTERVRRKPKGLPPTAPPLKTPYLPPNEKEKEIMESISNKNIVSKEIKLLINTKDDK